MSGPSIIPLLGRALILAALGVATAGMVLGFVAGAARRPVALGWTRKLAFGFCALIFLATGVMEFALLTHDFSVSYVAQVGSLATPTHITIVSLWSSLEGSILFWQLVLALFTVAFLWKSRNGDLILTSYTLATILLVETFFSFLLAAPANPFRALPAPIPMDGPGPNPLLQNHPLMIIHPPMLYSGYVGLTVPFAMGIAALLRGQLTPEWMSLIRKWTLIPWGFLTAGIILGGWWAYEVLGWGGYWAWDPVENASFLPWLTATAFLHAAMLQERRGMLKGWTLVLLLVTFSLTILGTFMTRSGVFNSVHSFTQSDIGPTLLVFLAIVMLGSIVLLSLRAHLLEPGHGMQSAISREAAFIFNNLLFVAFTFTVLIGTTFPLIAEAVRGVKVSVGEPFFNQFAAPIGVAIVFLMGIGPALPWGDPSMREVRRRLLAPALASLIIGATSILCGMREIWPVLTLMVSAFAMTVSLREMIAPIRTQMQSGGESLIRATRASFDQHRRRYGGHVVHLGVCTAVVAISLSSTYKTAREEVIKNGQTLEIGDYALKFLGSRVSEEPHRSRTIAQIAVTRRGDDLGILEPAMNQYFNEMNAIGTPQVRTTWKEDLYLSVMQVDPQGAFVSLRVYVNPVVMWLWVAMGMMIIGCLIAVWPQRSEERWRTNPK